MMLRCGGEQFRAGFAGTGTTQVNVGGFKADRALLHAGLDTGHGV